MTDRSSPFSEEAFETALQFAQKALESGRPVYDYLDGERVIVIPDIVEVAAHADGLPDLPESWKLRRDDGRTVKFFDGNSPIVAHKFKR